MGQNGILKLLALLFLVMPATVRADQYGDFTYSTDGTNITITGYTGSGGEVKIPDTINGLPVTTIGCQAFANCSGLTNAINVVIGSNVTTIADDAFFCCTKLTAVVMTNSVISMGYTVFYNCPNLTNITLSASLTSIGPGAFAYCASLRNVTIPASVTNIGADPFEACPSLTAIAVDATNSFYSSVAGVLFDKSQTTLIQCPGAKAGSYAIPNGVTDLAEASFFGCASLTSVTIPNGVASIGFSVFDDCSNLVNITIPPSVTSIGDDAFEMCGNLTNVLLPSGLTSIGNCAFTGCTKLTRITIPKHVYSIGEEAFGSCNNLTAVFFTGNAPIEVGWGTFNGCNVTVVYYLPKTFDWERTFGNPSVLTALWNPQFQTGDASFGIHTNCLGFSIAGTTNIPIVLEAATNLTGAPWTILQSCTLTNGSIYFSDPAWTNFPSRFYRIRSP